MNPLQRIRFLALLVLQLPLTAGAQPDGPRSEWPAIDSFIESRREFARIPGVALAVVQDKEIVYLRGYGAADPDGRPVTPEMPFMVGSLSKSFTALAVMQLVEAGKVDLDQPVQRYLPWFRVADERASGQITVRQLLNQTSGLSFRSGRLLLADSDASAAAVERHVRSLASQPLSSAPGTQYEYSNANYDAAGLIVEVASGLLFEEYVRRNVFEPLAMRHSYASLDDAKRGGLPTGHRIWFGWPVAAKNLPFIRGELPAGGLMSSAENMAHWLIAHLNEGRYQDASVLSPAGMEVLHTPPPNGWYGMGWAGSWLGNQATLTHHGDTAGSHSQMVIVPSARLGVVVLINVNSQLDHLSLMGLADGVAALILGQTPSPPAHDRLATYIYAAIAALIVAQAAGFAWSLRILRRASAANSPPIKWSTLVWALAALALDLAVVVVLTIVVPDRFETTLDAMLQAQPDASWPGLAAALFSLCWGPLRTLLLVGRLPNQQTGVPGEK
ncbi:MAG TPA: serine hydrolase domain-containing protein [Pirellulales bacterium]|nr:serine hydrolase domain-containing protein [Pirellulales bacterium]